MCSPCKTTSALSEVVNRAAVNRDFQGPRTEIPGARANLPSLSMRIAPVRFHRFPSNNPHHLFANCSLKTRGCSHHHAGTTPVHLPCHGAFSNAHILPPVHAEKSLLRRRAHKPSRYFALVPCRLPSIPAKTPSNLEISSANTAAPKSCNPVYHSHADLHPRLARRSPPTAPPPTSFFNVSKECRAGFCIYHRTVRPLEHDSVSV